MSKMKLTVQELVQVLFQQDKELADENEYEVEKNGIKAYDGWLQSSSSAGDSQTREDLESVNRAEFAREWEELAWAQEENDEDEDDDEGYCSPFGDKSDYGDYDDEDEDEWLDALNGRR